MARRWDPAVGARLIKLLEVLGEQIDGRIEGLSLPETSVGFGDCSKLHPTGFTYDAYTAGVETIMTAARRRSLVPP